MNEHEYTALVELYLTVGTDVLGGKNCPSITLPTTHPTGTALGSMKIVTEVN